MIKTTAPNYKGPRFLKLIQQQKTPLLLTIVVLAIYLSNLPFDYRNDLARKDYRRLLPTADVVPNTFLPYVLLKHQTFSFDSIDQYLRVFDANNKLPYFLIKPETTYFSAYPIFTGLIALPFYVIPILLDKIPTLTYWENLLKMLVLGRISASILTTLGVLLFYKTLKMVAKTKNEKWLFFISLFYALGTTSYSISSRGMWQHTVSQLLIMLFIFLHIKYLQNNSPKTSAARYLVLGLAAVTRPTNMVFSGILYLYLLFSETESLSAWKRVNVKINLVSFLQNSTAFLVTILQEVFSQKAKTLLIGLPILLTLIYNFYLFGNPFVEGYAARDDFNWTTPLITSLSGFLFSPARSFLFISPPLLLSFIFIVKLFSKGLKLNYGIFYKVLTLPLTLHIIIYAKWYTWDGANGFGYRMLTDILPILGLFSYLYFEELKPKLKILVCILCVYSMLIHINAVYGLKSKCSRDNNWTFKCLTPDVTYLQKYLGL